MIMCMTLGLKFLLFIPKCKFVLISKNPHSDVDNYDKASYTVLSYPQPYKANLFARLFICHPRSN